MQSVGSGNKRRPRAVVPSLIVAAIIGAVAVNSLIVNYGSVHGGNSPRETFFWALMAALAAATLAGAVLSATGWRLGQPLLYGAASGYFFLTFLVPLTGWVFVPAGVLAIFGAGMPRVNAPVVVASMMVPWAVIAVGLAATG